MHRKKFFYPLLLIGFIMVGGCGAPAANEQAAPNRAEAAPASKEAEAGGEASDTGEKVPQELIIADQEIAAALDPVQPLTSSYLIAIGAGETLFKADPEGKIQPVLAESAEAVDAKTWKITLKPEAKFWSGKKVDAAAVVASLERSRKLDKQVVPYIQDLTFSVTDDAALQVKTAHPNMDVPLSLSSYQTLIHNAEAAHDAVGTMDLSGMYKVTAFEPQKRMELAVNDEYWGEKPAIARVVHEQIADEQTRMLSVLSGSSHIAQKMPVSAIEQLQAEDKVKLSTVPASNTQTVYLNLKQDKFRDVRVRQALSWGIDREELILQAAEGQSFPVTTWLSSNPAFAEARDAVYAKFDLERAGKLLDEAGWTLDGSGVRTKNGEPFTLTLMTWGGDRALGETLQYQWTQLGIQADIRHGDYSLIESARETGQWDAFIEAWSTFGEPHTLLSGQYAPEGSGNYGGFDDAKANELLERLEAATDAASRHARALEANAYIAEQAPVISLYPRPQVTAVSRNLEGFVDHFRPFENLVNANLKFVSP
ncbi:ABC transporter substrate-binding protein [Saccharibacillus brassicae]|uniref:ABC transporter substrate-binding protein n=1 Tax=Saccharibacillus brassicae TaxID=2583377 RepID=A0A4Y6US11_SACBS|nr:ABC transporter substrate-binding protein [Saccharibacillus brassicae]QDH19834.1 ABC transporter substrate-binding protein [Saccharibacillus brassicae]